MQTLPTSPLPHNLSGTGQNIGSIREQAVQLESVFLNTLVSEMFSGLETRNIFGGGQAEETWRSMQTEHIAGQIADAGGIGLADDIMRTLLAQQEAADHAPATSLQIGELSK